MSGSQLWSFNGGAVNGTNCTLPAATSPQHNLMVIDKIVGTGQSASASVMTISIDGAVIAPQVIGAALVGAAGCAMIDLTFDQGLPMWSVNNLSTVPETGVIVILAGSAALTSCSLWVLFHWENRGTRTT